MVRQHAFVIEMSLFIKILNKKNVFAVIAAFSVASDFKKKANFFL